MSYIKRKSQVVPKQQSIDYLQKDNHYLQVARKKYKKSLKRNHTHSIQSLEVNRCSLNLPQPPIQIQKRKLHSIHVSNTKSILTERPQMYEETAKLNHYPKFSPLQFRHRSDRLHTTDEGSLQCKQNKIKNCIQLMQGVLNEIKNQKSSRVLIKPRIKDQFSNDKKQYKDKEDNPSASQSKFQSYVKTITVKHDNKLLLLKKAKSRSILNKQNIRSSIVLNADKFQTIIKSRLNKQDKPQSTTIQRRQSVHCGQPNIILPETRRLEQISCSSIDNVNQSSFISSVGRKSFVRQLQCEIKETLPQKQTIDTRRMLKINTKRLKSIFPDDFF